MPQTQRSHSAAQIAREQTGLSVQEAARRAQIGERYLRQIERSGAAPYHLARRLSALYGDCSLHCFLPQPSALRPPTKPKRKGGK